MFLSSIGSRSSTSSRSTRPLSPARKSKRPGGSAGRRQRTRSTPASGARAPQISQNEPTTASRARQPESSRGKGEEAQVAEHDDIRGPTPQIDEFTDADIKALSKTPLLHELSDEDAEAVRPHTHVVTLRRGEHLYEEGAVDDKLYVVIEGKVKLTRTSSDGREVLVRVQGPGEMFGELAMFDPTYRTSTATAITDTRLALIAHDDLRKVLNDRPAIALLLLRELAQRLRIITDAN